MTEQDLFEQRLRAALRRHTADAPVRFDALDFAHAAATQAPRRRGLARAVAWRPAPAPMPAWVIVMTVLLLTALVAGLLVVGSPLTERPKLPAVVPPVFPAFACPARSNPDAPGPVGRARPPQAFTAWMAFDRRAGRFVMLADPDGGATQTWTFDVCTNTWTRMADGPVGSGWDQLVYDADSDLTITVDSGTYRVWAYDLTSDTWTAKALAPATVIPSAGRARLAYDPVSGNVIRAFAATPWKVPDLWSYDVGTDTWAAISAGGFSGNVLVAYDASVDRLVTYDLTTGGDTYNPTTRLFDLRNGTWDGSAATSPEVNVGWFATGGEIAYDETAHRTVLFSAGRMIAYDAAADRWTVVFEQTPAVDGGYCLGPRCRLGATAVYDPVNERLVVYGGQYRDPAKVTASQSPSYSPGYGEPALGPASSDWVQDDGVLAFDLETRTWITLVEATRVRPAS